MTFPTNYVKGKTSRLAFGPFDAADLEDDGFVRGEDVPASDVPYKDLQAEARRLGIPAKGEHADLFVAIAEARTEEERLIALERQDPGGQV